MAEKKKSIPVWRLEDQEWWKKYSAMVNGTAKEEDILPAPPCPTVPGHMTGCVSSGSGSGSGLYIRRLQGVGSYVSTGSVRYGSMGSGSGSGSGGFLLGYGLHLI